MEPIENLLKGISAEVFPAACGQGKRRGHEVRPCG